MLSLPPSVRIFVAREPADMRKSFDGLSALATAQRREDPLSGHLFVFCNRAQDRLKILWWDRSGFVVLAKRLERGRFHFVERAASAGTSFELRSGELLLIMEGLDLAGAQQRARFGTQETARTAP